MNPSFHQITLAFTICTNKTSVGDQTVCNDSLSRLWHKINNFWQNIYCRKGLDGKQERKIIFLSQRRSEYLYINQDVQHFCTFPSSNAFNMLSTLCTCVFVFCMHYHFLRHLSLWLLFSISKNLFIHKYS